MILTRPILALMLALLAAPVAAATPDGDAGAYLAARSAALANDYRQSTGWFTRALIADPNNPGLLEGALAGQVALGNFEAATAIAQRMQQAGMESQLSHIVLLTDQAKRGAFDDLLADQKAGRKIGVLVDGLTGAWAELGAGRMSEALAGFDVVAASPGLEAFGLYHKAMALASVGDFEGATEILSGRASGTLQLTRRGALAYAEILSQLERNPEALALLDKEFGPQADPGVDALRAALTAGETLPFTIASSAQDGMAEVFHSVATALNGEAVDGYTLVYVRVAAHLRPDHADAVLLAASLLEAQAQLGLAAETYGSIPPDDPAFYAAEIGRADAIFRQGDVPAAVAALEALAQTHPRVINVHVALGDLFRREEQFDAASQAYDRAIALISAPERRHWALFYTRAITHEREKRWDLAEADFRKALDLNPEQPQVLNYLGYALVERREKLEEALAMIQRAVAAQPDSGYIVDSLAWALYTLGRAEEAVVPMEKASLLEPVDPIVTDHLGDVYWAVGRKLEAEFQWRRALSFEPEEADAIRIRRKLELGLDAVLAEEAAKAPADAPAPADGN